VSEQAPVVGRFAPSPTGPLHLGSLYTALGSFLQARHQQGRWLVRMDDLDTPRNVKGADSLILATLEAFGLHWDGDVMYQSQCLDSYQDWLQRLENRQQLYPCICSRKTLSDTPSDVYPGYCRHLSPPPSPPHALRVKTDDRAIIFDDALQGRQSHQMARQHGDFILKRKDGIIAYQFAVVIDDYLQQVTEVVRGSDLLTATPRQIYLQQLLGLPTPRYLHLPVIVDDSGAKLSKQNKAQAVALTAPEQTLFKLVEWLRQLPPKDLRNAPVAEQLAWAIAHWQPEALTGTQAISLH